jgi:ComF family protein
MHSYGIIKIGRSLLANMAAWLLPGVCVLCGQSGARTRFLLSPWRTIDICQLCSSELPWLNAVCYRCANPLGQEKIWAVDDITASLLCGECMQKPPAYDSTIALFYYHFPLDHMIGLLKFHNKIKFAHVLGAMMAEKIHTRYGDRRKPELIIPMPLHPQRLKERGYNQAVELARPIAKKLGIPLSLTDCVRVANTMPQSVVAASERQRNVSNAFSVKLPSCVEYVALVDDVMTTGSSVTELARTLKKAGVVTVDVWCCARTVLGC